MPAAPDHVPWWRDAVVYQIYPRSFADANGDGVGDLDGIRAHLDYVAGLGADAIWLSPIYPSPMADNGYDVSDYCNVAPVFGDLARFDALLADAHGRGLRVLLDWVPNHTSDQHPWFVASRRGRDDPFRDWYYWRDGRDGGPPNNWPAAFDTDTPAWTWDDRTGQWYLHTFLPQQPDLNWGNPDVRDAMHATLRFWLDRGVDGFRMDVVHLIGKDPALPDVPAAEAHTSVVGYHDVPVTHDLLRGIRRVLDGYPGDRMAVGEVNLRGTAKIAPYYGAGDELNLVFNFASLEAGWDAARWTALVDAVQRLLPGDAWPTWVLSNHDVPRQRTRLGGSERRARALAVLLTTLRGTPFLYAGDELGLEDAQVPPAQANDPGHRDGARAPIPWEPAPPHGWTGTAPWLPFPPAADVRNPPTLDRDPRSILELHRALLRLRHESEALRRGALTLLPSPPGVLAYRRTSDGDVRVIAVNFTAADVAFPPAGADVVDVASDGRTGFRYDGAVPAETAVVLRVDGR